MSKPPRGRLTLRETIAKNQAALDMYAAFSNRPRVVLRQEPEPKQRAAPGSDGRPLERDVQDPLIELLRVHPKVAWFFRVNSGQAVAQGSDGRERRTAFYRLYLRGEKPITKGLSDVVGQLVDGRMFVMEAKRPGVFKGTAEQEDVIAACRAAGGVAGIVQSLDDAVELLARA